MARIVQATKDIIEHGLGLADPKVVKAGSVGVVEDDIVLGHSVWVNFGRIIGTITVSESSLRELEVDNAPPPAAGAGAGGGGAAAV